LPANSLATRPVAGKARSYSHGLLAETMTKAERLPCSYYLPGQTKRAPKALFVWPGSSRQE